MASATSSPEQLVILDRVTWDTYERLITEHGERCGTRFTYDEGVLQIMVVSSRHEIPNRTLATLESLRQLQTSPGDCGRVL
jgi:Uma2 family endonuclease